MPHIIVKMYPGRTDEQKDELAKRIEKDVVEVSGCSEDAVSIAFEEIEKESWKESVYVPDIENKADTIWKKPGYKM